MKNLQRIKKLEKYVGGSAEEEFIALPSEWANKIDIPPNLSQKILWLPSVVLDKYQIEWCKYYERFKI